MCGLYCCSDVEAVVVDMQLVIPYWVRPAVDVVVSVDCVDVVVAAAVDAADYDRVQNVP